MQQTTTTPTTACCTKPTQLLCELAQIPLCECNLLCQLVQWSTDRLGFCCSKYILPRTMQVGSLQIPIRSVTPPCTTFWLQRKASEHIRDTTALDEWRIHRLRDIVKIYWSYDTDSQYYGWPTETIPDYVKIDAS